MKTFLTFLLLTSSVFAQTKVSGVQPDSASAVMRLGSFSATAPCRTGNGIPNMAGVRGDCYFQEDAAPGNNLWWATATGNPAEWVLANTIAFQLDGDTAYSAKVADFVTGTGMFISKSNDGAGKVTYTFNSNPTSGVNSQTGTTYTFLNSDCGKLVTFSNASSIAATLPQAGASSEFANGCVLRVRNLGAGTVTITPTTSTVDGSATATLTQGQGFDLYSNGTNYFTQPGKSSGASPAGSDGNLQKKSGSGFAAAVAGTDSIAPGGAVASVNGDTTAAQVINGAQGISVSTAGGTTTVSRSANTTIDIYLPAGPATAYIADSALALSAANTLYGMRWYQAFRHTISTFYMRATAVSGSCEFGVYSDAGTKLAGTGVVNMGALSPGLITLTLSSSYELAADTTYIIGFTCDNATQAFNVATVGANASVPLNAGTRIYAGSFGSTTGGALPSSLGTATGASIRVPIMKIQ